MQLVFLGHNLPSPPLLSFVSRLFLGAADWLKTPGARATVPGLHERSLAPTYRRNHFIPLTIMPNLLGRALTIATADPLYQWHWRRTGLNSKFNGTVVPPPPGDILAPYEKPLKVYPTLSATILFVLLLEPPVTVVQWYIPKSKLNKKLLKNNIPTNNSKFYLLK